MPRKRPEFTKSSYFVDEPGNWHLRPGAPKEMQVELENYLSSLENLHEDGTINGNQIDIYSTH
ncbi:hypothetical protein FB550_11916 [Neobacillus bataviensis]|uniref:Uncharacterized protein n=1 Tax=Neobacillus bataviensis TaxID=220685 RepID=A0A561CM99_9BACI|nr:hypothetical protein [Neobacillus bataviensis]TWD92286.1 hypothetical protein FB550_11916 [Neobacillus bataviensis]